MLEICNCKHCYNTVDGTTYFAGDDAEWKCFIPKEIKKAMQGTLPADATKVIRPATFVAPVHLAPVPGVKTCAMAAHANVQPLVQSPVDILSEIYPVKYDVKRLSETPPIFFVSLNIEGCQFQGHGATKAESKRTAAEAALASIEAIWPVANRLRARKDKLLGLKHPEGVNTRENQTSSQPHK